MRLITILCTALLVASATSQTGWFESSLLERPDVKKAMGSIDGRATAIVDEWTRLVEIPGPSKKEQARAQYITRRCRRSA